MRHGVPMHSTISTTWLLVRFHPVNRIFHVMVRLVNVPHRTLLQALRERVVFFPRYIVVRLVQ